MIHLRTVSRFAAMSLATGSLLLAAACSKTETPPVASTPGTTTGTGDECVQADEPWAKGFQADHCEMADGSIPPINPTFWPDVCTPNLNGWTPTQTSFDQFSWRSLLFTSWPADPGHPGRPDTSQPLGAMQGEAFLPTVWESFKNAEDLSGPSAASLTAADFAKPSAVAAGCSATGPRVLSMTSKVPHPAVHAVLEAQAAGLVEELGSVDQAFRGPLVDQNGRLVYYEIRINDVEFNAIVSAGAQNKSPAELNCTTPYNTPTCVPFTFPVGSIEVKAAWKQLTTQEASSGSFYRQTLQIEDPSGGCSEAEMGLVGLHIAHKTTFSLNTLQGEVGPSWAWSTYEHTGNVPPPGSSGAGGSYSFFNPECKPTVTAADCAKAAGDGRTANPDPAFACCENLYRYAPGKVPPSPTPDQITRIDNPPTTTATCNAVYAKTERGIWDNYSLVMTQWPKGGEEPVLKVATPPQVRNAVIESYFTQWENGNQVNTSSCMGCHFGSQAVDMSYLFLNNTGE